MADQPEWFNIALLMEDMARKLPSDWDHTPDFWLGSVQCLAEAIAGLRDRVPLDLLGTLLGAGGLMVAQAVKETEATDLAAALLARIKH